MRIVMIPPLIAGTIACAWLTTRKQPGKFCRPRQFRHRHGGWSPMGKKAFSERYQSIAVSTACGTALA